MLESIIKPCPKCGANAEIKEEPNGYSIICCSRQTSNECCGEFGEMLVMVKAPLSEAIRIWNRRMK